MSYFIFSIKIYFILLQCGVNIYILIKNIWGWENEPRPHICKSSALCKSCSKI